MKSVESYQQIINKIPNFRKRDAQLKMVMKIEECFSELDRELKDGHNLCLIEAPTGTGKSFAYIVAGLEHATQAQKKLLISTATKTLQGQLFNQDIPHYLKYSENEFNYGLAKGRSNYLCPYQLENSIQDVAADMLSVAEKLDEKLLKINQLYQKRRWDGDLDNAPIYIDNKLKPYLTIDKHQCLAYQCPHNQKGSSNCPYFKNREYLRDCTLIITNHSLLLADLAAGGGVALPWKPDEYFLCIDEAHNFTDYAINGFMGQFELKDSFSLVNNLAKTIVNPSSNSYLTDDVSLCDLSVAKVNDLALCIDKFYQLIRINQNLFVDNLLILNDYLNPAINQSLKDLCIELAFTSAEVLSSVNKIQDKLKEKIKISPDFVTENNLIKLGFYLSAIETITTTAEYLINQDSSQFNANARWVEYTQTKQGEQYLLVAGVTHVGNLLADKLWSRVHAVCLTSATLAVGESFDYLKLQLGLNLYPQIKSAKLSTHFNYPEHSQLVIPQFRSAPEYQNRELFQKELDLYLAQILNYHQAYGTLVLFFNRQQLITTHHNLSKKIQAHVLLQTEYSSNQRLIEDHKQIIDSGAMSIIFGLNSFAEGVDLPTKYCMHVVVTKLPFETHKDPQNMVREYWVKAEKGNYFMERSLPEASIRLIQAVGRLIRSEKDYGQVTICDNRIVLKAYGNIMLNALPKFNRQYNASFITEAFAKIEH